MHVYEFNAAIFMWGFANTDTLTHKQMHSNSHLHIYCTQRCIVPDIKWRRHLGEYTVHLTNIYVSQAIIIFDTDLPHAVYTSTHPPQKK